MKMIKPYIVLTIVIVALGAALATSINYATRKEEECVRLSQNQSTLLGQMRVYTIRDSINVASVGALTLRSREFEHHFGQMSALVRDLGVKIGRVESVAQSGIASKYLITTPVRDTVVVVDTISGRGEQVQMVEYRDSHISLRGVILGGTFEGAIECRDTLTQVVHRVPRKLWFIKWGTKELRQKITSANPHTKIVYTKYIQISK